MIQDAITLKYRRLRDDAYEPEYSSDGAAGLDLRCVDIYPNLDDDYIEYSTGIAVVIPKGYVGLLFPRSSISKTPHTMANSVGVIDSDYRGEVKLRFKNDSRVERTYSAYMYGDKIGQLVVVPAPKVYLEEVSELDDTSRGTGGFGSTGR